MSYDKYKNEKGVYIDVNTDKRGKDHINIYDGDPRGEHDSIHINLDSKTGKGSITDTTNGSKETTDVSCFLTTACMKHMKETFDDNCEELTILRWFRDNFVDREDIDHYYVTAPIIVDAINQNEECNEIYQAIYYRVIKECVEAINRGDFDFAYQRYKESILELEKLYVRPILEHRLIMSLKRK